MDAQAAEAALQRAITDALESAGYLGSEAILGDWHVMCEVTNLSEQGKTQYVNIIPGINGVPMHRVKGLIEVCAEMLDEQQEE